MPMSPTAGSPLYMRIADMLTRDIDAGLYAVGNMLPPEAVLCKQYGVSRHTVREALRRLGQSGIVAGRHGVGTQVKSRAAESHYVASLNTLSDLYQYTQRTRLKVLDEARVTADAELAAQLHCRAGQAWVKFETCRFPISGEAPISYTEIYVYPAYADIRKHLDDRSVWVYGVIEKSYGERIVEAQQEIEPIAASARIARLLDVKRGAPALLVRRYYLGSHDRLLSVSVNTYPENRFTVRTSWRLQAAG